MVMNEPQTVKVRRNMTITNVRVKDSSGACDLTFFNMPFMKNLLKSGGFYIFRGLVQTRNKVHVMSALKIMEQPRLYSQGCRP